MSELELADAILRHSLQLQRLSAHEEGQVLDVLKQLEGELRALLARTDLTEAGRREIAALIRQADEAIAGAYGDIPSMTNTKTLVLHVAQQTADALKIALPNVSLPTDARLASLGADVLVYGSPASEWWAKQAEDTQFKFAAAVKQGVLLGETIDQITRRVVGNTQEPGILDVARRNARALVHSSVMSAANQARLATYRKNAKNVAGVRWLATLDGRTCLECIALDGQSWDLKGNPLAGTTADFQFPPAHFSCRCVLTPIAKGLDEIFGTTGLDKQLNATTRASSQGPVQAVNFNDFLKRQSPSFVSQVLGKRRAELYLAGKITLRDLISGTGRELTLDELMTQ